MTSKCPIKFFNQFSQKQIASYTIVLALFFNVSVTLGVSRSLTMFLKEFRDHYNLNYTSGSAFIAVYMSLGGLSSIFFAKLCKSVGAKPVCVISSIIGTLSWLTATLYIGPNKNYSFKIFLIFVGISGAFHGGVLVNAPVEVNRWFSEKQRPLVNAIVWSGSSFGAILVGPIFGKILENCQDWLKTLFYLSLVQGIVMVLTCLCLVEPSDYDEKVNIIDEMSVGDVEEQKTFKSDYTESNSDKTTSEKDLLKENKVDKITFKALNKYALYKIYILSQIFYGLWRAGVTTYLLMYARDNKGFTASECGFLLSIWAVCEFLCRPLVGKYFSSNRYISIGVLFCLQAIVTSLVPVCTEKWMLQLSTALLGTIQGGTGGLFMTAAIDAVGVDLARYAYSVENTIDVVVAGGVVHLYGRMVDRSGNEWSSPQDKIYYLASIFIFIAGIFCFVGSRMKRFCDYK